MQNFHEGYILFPDWSIKGIKIYRNAPIDGNKVFTLKN